LGRDERSWSWAPGFAAIPRLPQKAATSGRRPTEEPTVREVMARMSRSVGVPPAWTSVLAVIAHPDDASVGLGAILDAFVFGGARVDVLCLTHGQAWTLQGAPGDLAALRGAELASAVDVLGPARANMLDCPDGALGEGCRASLVAEVVAAADSCFPDGLLVFDTAAETGHLDHVTATSAGLLAAETLDLPVLGWALSDAVAAQLKNESGTGSDPGEEIDLRVTVDRARQRLASHASHALQGQALPGSARWRRLELLADTESLRWLRPPRAGAGHRAIPARPTALVAAEGQTMRVEHRGGDKFDINVRGHTITVDQPVKDGGVDAAPTPTELFVASLASCVAFYARRYLARHNLPEEGLAVEATFEMGSKPARVSGIDVRLIVPGCVPAGRRDALLAVAKHCTVHNTLAMTPEVSVTLADAQTV
jgi:LmbE family N-acetylglucosaminyl deacetylase/uncharacterized OsmC-like protein